MSVSPQHAKAGRLKWTALLLSRFGDPLKKEGLSPWRVRFRDPAVEARYIDHLVTNELGKERAVDIAGIVLYFAYGTLDILTITQNLDKALLLRWGMAVPLAAILISLTYVERLKRYFGFVTIAIMFVFANAITAIILQMQTEAAPPYLIGIFFVFIFCSCVQRMDFIAASAAYVVTAAVYIGAILLKGDLSQETAVSSSAFMVSFVVIAAGTSYVQEMRSRRIWLRDRQRAEDAAFIERLLIEATAADRSKNNFLSVVTHELRTPLHQIIGFTEVMRLSAGQQPNETDEYLRSIHTAAHQLLSRIAKILRYAETSAGKVRYQRENSAILEVIQGVAGDVAAKAGLAGVRLDISKVEPFNLEIDPNHTRYALINLVENGIDASPRGSVVALSGALCEDGSYEIVIEDQGRGMTSAQIDAALRPFTQADDPRTRSFEGLGLGLTLAHRLLTDQGADIKIHSKVSIGTVISVRFKSSAPLTITQAAFA
jgi:signal transduction histidine kinase